MLFDNILFDNKYCSILNENLIIKNSIQYFYKNEFTNIIANNGDSTNNNIGSNDDYIIDNNNLYQKINLNWKLVTDGSFIIISFCWFIFIEFVLQIKVIK